MSPRVALLLACVGFVACTSNNPDMQSNPPIVNNAVVCAGVACAMGQACCLTTGQCFDATRPADCTVGDAPVVSIPAGTVACNSNVDCASTEFCMPDSPSGCLGRGHCQPRWNCGSCGPPGTPNCEVCGCDGMTYASIQNACAAGVRFNGGACGVGIVPENDSDASFDAAAGHAVARLIPCGRTTDCPLGASCCAITGTCMPADCADCCRYAPPGTDYPCRDSTMCSDGSYCAGATCDAPGGCVRVDTSRCNGVLAPVCGCDGHTYDNECIAELAGTRVATWSACP